MNIYFEQIIDLYQHPRNFGRLKKPTVSHEEVNVFCGDKIRMDLGIKNDQIIDVAFGGSGCAISIASASLLTDMVHGKKLALVKKITKENLLQSLNIELTPTRLKCAWLSWEVLQKALKKL
ncbi:iron-sulfur cluster assembly scaffold protein [Candidatus Gottesmanbacteria bacterium]|nr:iron-sulfur cluster assembly scaffold protein [Candidatus Gottesmanbacteria bacterium]